MTDGIRKSKFSKKDIFIFVLMGCTGVLITAAGIYFKQDFLNILPLYISLIIAMLQSRVNRYASLMGSVNSLLYGAVYIYYNLYGSAFSAILFSCPVQLLTFIRWNKNKWEHSTKLRKLSIKQRLLILTGCIIVLIAMWVILPLIGSKYVFLDSLTNIIGILIYFLTMFAYVEYTFLMIINGIICIVLYITMLPETPEMTTHLIFSIYSFVCIVFAFFRARKLYDNQQAEVKNEN
ncbi:MAG: nicotinamide riboside transporter PnuC [Acutalibacteraceae bacterium]|nr:nicotinamide riboside transporter PnuC [Acutalibacteraceae bacterium]